MTKPRARSGPHPRRGPFGRRLWVAPSFCTAISLFLTLLLAACGYGARAEERGNIGVVAFPNELPDYDPSLMGLNEPAVLLNVYETLTFWTPDGLRPKLATEWEANAGGNVWTFKLRKGVRFHDGAEFTAAAVKSSFERTIDKEVLSYVFLPVTEMAVVDDYIIRFTLAYPAPLDYILSNLYGAMIISPAALAQEADWFRQNAAGTGPYLIQSHDENQRLVLARYTDYWGGWEDDQYTMVVYEFIEDGPSREQMIRAGDADFTLGLPEDTYPILDADPNVTVDVAPSFQHISIHLNTQKPPLNDVRVRRALAYSFPYADVVRTIWGGYGKRTSSLAPGLIWGAEQIPTVAYEYDLERAQALLEEAGVAGGFDLYFPYTTSDFESVKQLGELWKAALAKLNIDLRLVALSYDTLYSGLQNIDLSDEAAHDVFAMLWWPGYASPHEFLAIEFASYAIFRTTGYDNPGFDYLVDTALSISATDQEKAWEMFFQADQQLVSEAIALPVLEAPGIIAHRNEIQGFEQNANYSSAIFWYDLRRIE